MPRLHLDIETRSALNLKKAHAWRYAGHVSTDVWCIAYTVDDAPVQVWKPGEPVPEEFHIAARESGWTVVAHNAGFERSIADRILTVRYGFPAIELTKWRCSMAAALANALPADLGIVAAALDLPVRKDEEGRRLMLRMARPRKPRRGEDPQGGPYWDDDPEHLARLFLYCANDTEVERMVHHQVPPLADSEQALWVLDQIINRRGFAVDTTLAEAGDKIVKARLAAINLAVVTLTEGKIERINQVERLEAFLTAQGHNVTGVAKRNVAAVLARNPGPEVEQLLRLRQEGGKASAAKLSSLLAGADDGRLHGTMRFHKSATGRWAGTGFQPQNLLRTTPADEDAAIGAVLSGDLDRVAAIGPPNELVASLSRSLITAAPGCDLISGDFSAIESRLTAWYSGESWKLANYCEYDRTGDAALEAYCVVASRVLGRGITPDDEEGRQLGKLLDLAFGFGGGVDAFKRIAPDSGYTDEQIQQFKQHWRKAHPATCRFWKRLFRILRHTVRTGKPTTLGKVGATMRNGNLYMRLPSGREIVYPQAHLVPGKFEDPDMDNGKGWRPAAEWHGTFVENLVQGTARDLLAAAMLRVTAANYPIVLHVHDELVCEIPENFGSVEEFRQLITELPTWADGLPFAAKVSRRKRYAKSKKTAPTESVEESRPLDDVRGGATERTPEPVTQADIEAINVDLKSWGIEQIGTKLDHVEGVIAAGAVVDIIEEETSEQESAQSNGHDRAEWTDTGNGHDADGANYFTHKGPSGKPTEHYVYRNEQGETHQRKIRTSTKKFWQETWKDGRWIKGAPEIKYLYGIHALLAAKPDKPIWITEGEKDANALTALGLVAVTNPGGAGKWGNDFTPEQTERWFKGRQHVYLLEDNDASGRKHVEIVGRARVSVVWLGKLVHRGLVTPLARGQYDACNVVAGMRKSVEESQKVTAHAKAVTRLSESKAKISELRERELTHGLVSIAAADEAVTHVVQLVAYEAQLLGHAIGTALRVRYARDFKQLLEPIINRFMERLHARAVVEEASLAKTGEADPRPVTAVMPDYPGAEQWVPPRPPPEPYMGNGHLNADRVICWRIKIVALAAPHRSPAELAEFIDIRDPEVAERLGTSASPLTKITAEKVANVLLDETAKVTEIQRAVDRQATA